MCVFVCVYIYVCLSACVYDFPCALQAAKNVCVEEKEEAEERCKSETASKQPAVATASVSLPASASASVPPSFYFPFLCLNKDTQQLGCQVTEEVVQPTSGLYTSAQLFVPKLIIESTIAM